MAKKKERIEFDLNDFDFTGNEFNDEGFGSFEGGEPANGNKRQAITDFSGGFVSGLSNGLFTKDNQRRILRKVLPKGFTHSFDDAHQISNAVKEVGSLGRDELSKALGDYKAPIKNITNTFGSKIPKSIKDKITSWADSGGNLFDSHKTETEGILDEMQDTLNNTFSETAKYGREDAAYIADAVSESSAKQFAAQLSSNNLMADIAGSSRMTVDRLGRMIAMNENYDSKIRKKTLELSFRQFAVARQQLDILEQTRDLLDNKLSKIGVNTGLPDALKIQNLELAGQIAKQQLWGKVVDASSNSIQGIISHVTKNARETMKDFIGQVGMNAGDGISVLDQMANNRREREANKGNEDPFDTKMRHQMRGSMAGNFGAEGIISLLEKYGGKYTKGIKNNEKVQRTGKQLENLSSSLPSWFDRAFTNPDNPMVARLSDMLGLGELTFRWQEKVRGNAVKDLDKQAVFNMHTQLAITEVIPGHLESIRHILDQIRTGDDNVSAMRYNYTTGTFDNLDELKGNIRKGYATDSNRESVRTAVDSIIKVVDPEGVLSDGSKRALERYIVMMAKNDRGRVDIRALASDHSPIPGAEGEEIAKVTAESLGIEVLQGYDRTNVKDFAKAEWETGGKYQDASVDVSRTLNDLRDTLPRNLERTINVARTGNTDLLRDLGVIKYEGGEWKYDARRDVDLLLGNDPETGNPVTGNGPRTSPNAPGGGLKAVTDNVTRSPMESVQGPITPIPEPIVPQPQFTQSVPTNDNLVFQQDILQAVRSLEYGDKHDVANTLLEAIREQLANGIISHIGETVQVDEQARKTGYFKRLLKGSFSKFTKMPGQILGGIKRSVTGTINNTFGAIRGVGNTVLNAGQRFLGQAGNTMSLSARNVRNTLNDVYIMGQKKAAITKREFAENQYFDATTRKLIRKLGDIKGAVVDQDGNTVISQQQFAEGLYTLRQGRVARLITSVAGGVSNMVGGVFRAQNNIVKFALRQTIGRFTKAPEDVYVQGEEEPRLYARMFKVGGYFNKDGSTIRSYKDIRGDVYDLGGDIILTTREMSGGLFDKMGRELKDGSGILGTILRGGVGLVGGAVKGAVNLGVRGIKAVGRGYGAIGRGIIGGVGKLFGMGGKRKRKGAFGTAGGEGDEYITEMMEHQTTTLDDIYDLLDDRMAKRLSVFGDHDGDGLREGSRESWLKRKKDKDDSEKDGKDKPEKKRKSLFGLISAAVAGIGGVIGSIKAIGMNIWGMMRSMMMMRTAAQGAGVLGNLLGGLAGGRRGRFKRRSKTAGVAGFMKNNWGKMALAGAAAFGASRLYAGTGVDNESSAVIAGAEKKAMEQIERMTGSGGSGGGGGSGDGGSDGADENQDPNAENKEGGGLMNAVLGSVGGELLAILTGGAIAAGVGKMNKRAGKVLEEKKQNAGKKPTSRLGKIGNFITGTKVGRIGTAVATGVGGYYGAKALTGDDPDMGLGEATAASYGSTLGLELAAMIGIPWAVDKYKEHREKKALKNGQVPGPKPSAITGINGPVKTGGAPTMSPMTRNVVNPPNNLSDGPANTLVDAGKTATKGGAATAGRGGLKSLAGKAVRGLGRKSGLGALGFAAYDAATTKGDWKDKAAAAGAGAAQGMLFGKAIDFTAKKIGGTVARAVGGTALRGIGAAALPLLTNPVTLAAIGVAGAGYLGYKAWKRYIKKDNSILNRYRLSQYGVDLEKSEQAEKIFELERQMLKFVDVAKGKPTASFKASVSLEDILKVLGVSDTNEADMQKAYTWFVQRFRPVYLTNLGVYNETVGSLEIWKADESIVGSDKKQTYLNAVKQVEGDPPPYTVNVSPFPGQDKLSYSGSDLDATFERAIRDSKKEKSSTSMEQDSQIAKLQAFTRDEKKAAFQAELEDRQAEREKRIAELSNTEGKSLQNSFIDSIKATGLKAVNAVASSSFGQAISTGFNNFGNMMSGGGQVKAAPMSGTTKEKYNRIRKAAYDAGDPHPDIVAAQFGIESGWGKKESGRFNYFGIKAVKGEAGSSLTTHEVYGGKRVKIKDKFKDYNSLEEGIKDRINFIHRNPRYTKAGYFTAKTPAEAAAALKRGGYATDPNYANKLAELVKGAGYDPYKTSAENNVKAGYGSGTQPPADNQAGAAVAENGAAASADAPPGTNTVLAPGQTGIPQAGQTAAPSGGGRSFAGGTWMGIAADGTTRQTQQLQNDAAMAAATGMAAIANIGAGGTGNIGAVGSSADVKARVTALNPQFIALGQKSIRLADSGVDIKGMNQDFMKFFYCMVGEAVSRGVVKVVQVNSAFRTRAKQQKLYDEWRAVPPRRKGPVARPGSSRHESGVAIDIQSEHANPMARAGLLNKYFFTRPIVKAEPWHIENSLFKRGAKTGGTAKAIADASKQVAAEQKKGKTPATQNTDDNGKVVKSVPNPATQKQAAAPAPQTQSGAGKATSSLLAGGGNLMTSGFMPQQTPKATPSAPTPQGPGDAIADMQNNISRAVVNKQQQRESVQAAQASNGEVPGLLRDQLDVQRIMLSEMTTTNGTLKKLLAVMEKGGPATPPSASGEPSGKNSPARDYLNRQNAQDNSIPVSMSIR